MGSQTNYVRTSIQTEEIEQTTRELHKFGGSSLADVECFLRVAGIIRDYCGPDDLFVVSAAGKTTNRLIEFVELCGHDPRQARQRLEELFEYQSSLVNDLLTASEQRRVGAVLRSEFTWIRTHSEQAVEDGPVRSRILGHGEVWSARLLAALLSQLDMPAAWLDSRNLLRADVGPQPVINQSTSRPRVQSAVNGLANTRVVITGFMASNGLGDTVLLGRNGSDYSATMIGILAGSSQITIWSDVAGVYSADPRKIDSAELLPSISLREANELANLGASVLHRRSLQPVIEHNVSVALRSSYHPESRSTTLHRDLEEFGPKVVTTLDEVSLVSLHVAEGHDFDEVSAIVMDRLSLNELQPLAYQASVDTNQLCFVFPAVLCDAACNVLQSGELALTETSQGFGLVAVVGSGSGTSSTTHEAFMSVILCETNEPPKLLTQSDLSLFAVVKEEFVESLASRVHDELNVGCTTSTVCQA